jgi:hypothetical protein
MSNDEQDARDGIVRLDVEKTLIAWEPTIYAADTLVQAIYQKPGDLEGKTRKAIMLMPSWENFENELTALRKVYNFNQVQHFRICVDKRVLARVDDAWVRYKHMEGLWNGDERAPTAVKTVLRCLKFVLLAMMGGRDFILNAQCSHCGLPVFNKD